MTRQVEGTERKAVVSFTIEPNIIEKLTALAWNEHKTKSALVEDILVAYIKAHESGNPYYPLEKFGAGFKAYPTIWDDAYVETLEEYSEEELEEMRLKAERFVSRVDSLKKIGVPKQSDKERLGLILKRIHHLEIVLKNIDRNLGDPRKLQVINPEYVRKMYEELKASQAEYETLVKERAELVERISGKKAEANVGN